MRLTAKAILINTLLLILLILQLTFTNNARATSFPNKTLEPNMFQDELLLRTVRYTYNDSFSAAYSALDTILLNDPDYWPSNVFKIGVLYAEISDNESAEKLNEFYALIDTMEITIEKYLAENPDDKWAHYYKGTVMGYLAAYEGHRKNWVKAILKGLAAGKHYSKAIKIDSLFYEAYLGSGNLNYWRSAKIGPVRKLPFITDKREDGIKQLQICQDSSRYSSLPATTGLSWIYINKKDYKKTIGLMNNLMNQGYRGRQVLWPKGIAAFRIGHSEGVIASFSAIKDGLERKGGQNYYNIGLCNYYIGIAYYWRGEYTNALSHLNALLDQEVNNNIAKRLKKKYSQAKDYKKRIKKAVAKMIKENKNNNK